MAWLSLPQVACGQTRSAAPWDDSSGLASHGWLEPYRSTGVSAAEAGKLVEVSVKIGDVVRRGDVIARLDDELQQLQYEVAEQLAASRGAMLAAEAELNLRLQRRRQLEELAADGAAPPHEAARAQTEWELAQARLLSEQEQSRLRQLELRRAEAARRRRLVESPLDGVVADLKLSPGEFVSPVQPVIARIIQVHPILATIPVEPARLTRIRAAQAVEVEIEGQAVMGTIEAIGPETDRASGLTAVRIRIDNSKGRWRPGQSCRLIGATSEPTATPSAASE